MSSISKYIKELQKKGQHHFTTKEAVRDLDKDQRAITRALHRLIQKGELASPQRSFYIIVPPEYYVLGCLPAEQFIPQLMESVGELYYVGLLSAAQFHGAAHHRPQRFQVMVRKARASIKCGKIYVDFHVRKNLEQGTTVNIKTPRGYVKVASPETTALELVGYAKHAGGLDNVANILVELVELLNSEKLVKEAYKSPLAWAQRLGFLLELIEEEEITRLLKAYVQRHTKRVTPLNASLPRRKAKRSEKWKIAVNTEIEVDL